MRLNPTKSDAIIDSIKLTSDDMKQLIKLGFIYLESEHLEGKIELRFIRKKKVRV